MYTPLTLFVPGTPRPQGSKRQGRNGAMYEASRYIKAWREAISTVAWTEMNRAGAGRIDGAVELTVVFQFSRPKSHYTSKGLRPGAPQFVTSTPDLDKLMRAVGDGLVDGGVLRDDSLIVVEHLSKVYAKQAGARISVLQIPNSEEEE